MFNVADYPDTLVGLFQVEHDFPSVEPPEYLRQLSPELYRQEQARVQERFSEAVRLADPRSESVGESRARLLLNAIGFRPTPQKEIRDHNGPLMSPL